VRSLPPFPFSLLSIVLLIPLLLPNRLPPSFHHPLRLLLVQMFTMSDAGRKGSGGSTPIYTVGQGSNACLNGGSAVYSSLPVGDVPTTLT
jgi:hypothetical protein